jgi:hypothetical protein
MIEVSAQMPRPTLHFYSELVNPVNLVKSCSDLCVFVVDPIPPSAAASSSIAP